MPVQTTKRYRMKVEDQNSTELRSLAKRIEVSRTALLTMCDAQGVVVGKPLGLGEHETQALERKP